MDAVAQGVDALLEGVYLRLTGGGGVRDNVVNLCLDARLGALRVAQLFNGADRFIPALAGVGDGFDFGFFTHCFFSMITPSPDGHGKPGNQPGQYRPDH